MNPTSVPPIIVTIQIWTLVLTDSLHFFLFDFDRRFRFFFFFATPPVLHALNQMACMGMYVQQIQQRINYMRTHKKEGEEEVQKLPFAM